jgi:hypothetical protein
MRFARLLARQQHELPAAMATAVVHVGGRPPRVTPLARDRQVGECLHVVGLDVHDQPPLLEAEIAPIDAGGISNE